MGISVHQGINDAVRTDLMLTRVSRYLARAASLIVVLVVMAVCFHLCVLFREEWNADLLSEPALNWSKLSKERKSNEISSKTNGAGGVTDKDDSNWTGGKWRPSNSGTIGAPSGGVLFAAYNITQDKYIREPSVNCGADNLFLIYVYSQPENFARRQMIRTTWGNLSRYAGFTKFSLQLFFIIGQNARRGRLDELLDEASRHRDLLVADLIDSYVNLTLKGLTALDWIRTRCLSDGLRFVFKTDDDVFLNFYAVLNLVQKFLNRAGHFICLLNKGKHPKRDGKWAISPELYPDPIYPTYCSGAGYGMSRSALGLVLDSCFSVPLLPIEDYFFSSYCIRRVFPQTDIRYASFRKRRCLVDMRSIRYRLGFDNLQGITRFILVHPLPVKYWIEAYDIIEHGKTASTGDDHTENRTAS